MSTYHAYSLSPNHVHSLQFVMFYCGLIVVSFPFIIQDYDYLQFYDWPNASAATVKNMDEWIISIHCQIRYNQNETDLYKTGYIFQKISVCGLWVRRRQLMEYRVSCQRVIRLLDIWRMASAVVIRGRQTCYLHGYVYWLLLCHSGLLALTHWGCVTHVCISKAGHHWFR